MIEIGKDGWIALPDPAPETLPDGTLVWMPGSAPYELFGAKADSGDAYFAEFSRMSGMRYNGAFFFKEIVAIRLPEAPASEFYDAQPPDDELPERIDVAMGRDGWEHRGLSLLSSGRVYRFREAWTTVRRVPKLASSEECCAACGGPYEDGKVMFRGALVCFDCWELPEFPAALYERIRARGGWPRKATTETTAALCERINRASQEAIAAPANARAEKVATIGYVAGIDRGAGDVGVYTLMDAGGNAIVPAKCAFCGEAAAVEVLGYAKCAASDCTIALSYLRYQLRAGGVDCEATRRAALERLRRQRDNRSSKFAVHVHGDQRIAAAMRSEGKTGSRDPAPEPSTHPASWPEDSGEELSCT